MGSKTEYRKYGYSYKRQGADGKGMSFAVKESYNLLRTNIFFSFSDEEQCHVIGVTSSVGCEGKSVTAINLAASMAETGKKILLVDGDLRLPTAAFRLGLEQSPGLSNLLVGMNSVEKGLRKADEERLFDVIPAGEIPPNPTELLASQRFEKLMEELKKYYDYIIIDLPPVNEVSDAIIISKYVSGLILVVRGSSARRSEVNDMVKSLTFADAKILGFVYNGNSAGRSRYGKKYGSKYYYKHAYGKSGDKND